MRILKLIRKRDNLSLPGTEHLACVLIYIACRDVSCSRHISAGFGFFTSLASLTFYNMFYYCFQVSHSSTSGDQHALAEVIETASIK